MLYGERVRSHTKFGGVKSVSWGRKSKQRERSGKEDSGDGRGSNEMVATKQTSYEGVLEGSRVGWTVFQGSERE